MSLLPLSFYTLLELKELQTIVKFQLNMYKKGELSEEKLKKDLQEIIKNLAIKSKSYKETLQILQNQKDELASNCEKISIKIESQTSRIAYNINPFCYDEIYTGILEIESYIHIINEIILAYYSKISIEKEKDNILLECYKKYWEIIHETHIPLFEKEIDEYSEIIDGVTIINNDDQRKQLSEKMIKFPGMLTFINGFTSTERKYIVLNILKTYKETDASSMVPYSKEIISMIPCISSLNLDFTSEKEFNESFYKFFNEGNWLEMYTFLMIEKSGCSTRLLNVQINHGGSSLEADILALYKNKLYIFETKDRWLSEGLSEQDRHEIEEKLSKISLMQNITTIYVFNSKDEYIKLIKDWMENMAFIKGVKYWHVLFLNNSGQENLSLKIRECLE